MKNPAEVVKVHQKVLVTVLDVDLARKRISLSMKDSQSHRDKASKGEERKTGEGRQETKQKQKSTFSNNPFAAVLGNKNQ